ncbi:MAG: nucleotide sugar dehydrogenase [Planctomycetota bacterium]
MSAAGEPPVPADARVAVVGLGYVGLPLAVAFADAGFRVLGLDVDPVKCARINDGCSVTPDVPDDVVAGHVQAGRLRATPDFAEVADAALISICVPTPLSKSKDPDISYIVRATEDLLPHVRPGTVVVLESTTYPGTTREILLDRFEQAGLVVGRDVYLAFSPERVDPGNETWTIRNTPKVLGGLTEECGRRAEAFYARAIGTIVRVSCAETAEMAKLLENTFRAINIGLVNELAMVCGKLGLDVWEVIDAAATKPFGFMPFRPGPGLGGHCIPIDPLYLSWKMRLLDYKVRFIDLADEVNSGMPAYVVARAQALLNDHGKAVNGSRVLLLGVAYKADIDDVRESPALDLWQMLGALGADLSYHDPHVPGFTLGEETVKGLSAEEALAGTFDLILIATGHAIVDHGRFADLGVPVLDTRNVLPGRRDAHVHRL